MGRPLKKKARLWYLNKILSVFNKHKEEELTTNTVIFELRKLNNGGYPLKRGRIIRYLIQLAKENKLSMRKDKLAFWRNRSF